MRDICIQRGTGKVWRSSQGQDGRTGKECQRGGRKKNNLGYKQDKVVESQVERQGLGGWE